MNRADAERQAEALVARPGDINTLYKPRQRDSLPVRIIWLCIGIACSLFISAFVLKAAATIGAHFAGVAS